MATKLIDERRIKVLNDRSPDDTNAYVLYWMQHSQRAERNEALEFAIGRANEHGAPLCVGFGLTEDYPEGSLRHFQFMLEGLAETAEAIQRRNACFVLRLGSPDQVAIDLAKEAIEVVTDRGYLRHHRQWRESVAKEIAVRLTQVECDLIVPVETASTKREYAARTIRSKIEELSDEFLHQLRTTPVDRECQCGPHGESLDDIDRLLKQMKIDRSVDSLDWIVGGTSAARKRLKHFIEDRLTGYERERSDPLAAHVSTLSPYLHFGMISPVDVAIAVRDARQRRTSDIDSYLEELIVRRELAHNFTHYARADYDQFSCLPDWAIETLQDHRDDERPTIYTADELEHSQTDDEIWNAAMTEVREHGYLHNQLRMYWGKRFLEWTNTPEYAYRTLLSLNNKYFLDGRDANSFANVGWVFGLHDRAFGERPIFGKVRYLSKDGIEKKFDSEAYVAQLD
ncbi:deoxyribodipyrimidine photo-lyase [Roseiconus lacunae]|uniref:deoxyribodipyrimidine photo-lyase n=1 Tax=Roseiconus lacunae TaxID=2605694 RepID=UPI0011F37DB4|nr:deoxyribodipyrimidine photo-lyase [Roseiconus lacunae]